MIYKHINNPFLADRISDDNFNKLSSSHIGSLKAFVPNSTDALFAVPAAGILNTMITDTEACYDAWRLSADSKSSEKSKKEAKTISVDDSITELKFFISRKAGVIADKFVKGSPEYEEFFPLGLKEYSAVTKKNANTIFKRFINTLDTHKSDFDESVFTEASEKYNTYLALRGAQLQTFGKVKDGMTDLEQKRYKLSVQLYKNLLTLLLLNAEEPEKTTNFFDESILKKKSKTVKPPAPPQA